MTKFIARIIARSYQELRNLDKYHLDLKKRTARQLGTDKFVVIGLLGEDQIKKLKSAGYTIEILSDLSQISKERTQEVSKTNRFSSTGKSSDVRKSAALGGYMNADEVETAMVKLGEAHPDLVTVIDLPNKTWEGRISKAVRVHAGNGVDKAKSTDNQKTREGLLVTGSMHAREWGGSDICINFVTNLIDAYVIDTPLVYGEATYTAPQVKNLLEHIDLFVFPDVNPDGKIYSQTNDDPKLPPDDEGIWWRKNRNPASVTNPDNQTFHRTGVDINRNFDFLWESGIGTVNSDGTNSSETFRGTSAFSEPETKNVEYFFDVYKNIKYFVDVHSFGEMILYSWGDDDNQSSNPEMNFRNPEYDGKRGVSSDSGYKEYIDDQDENNLKELARKMNSALEKVRGRKYRVEQAVGLYPTSSTSDDYVFSRHETGESNQKTYGFTIEFGKEETGFIPPFSEMQNVIKEVSSALTALCMAVANIN